LSAKDCNRELAFASLLGAAEAGAETSGKAAVAAMPARASRRVTYGLCKGLLQKDVVFAFTDTDVPSIACRAAAA
jgi:hypothetical protein